jgi:hypothetical protein
MEAHSCIHCCGGRATSVTRPVCICNLRYPACNAHASYCHLWPALSYSILKSAVYSCLILMKLKFSWQIFEKYSNIKFSENPSSGSQVFYIQTDKTKLRLASITIVMHNSFILYWYIYYIIVLDMFRAILCSSSGGQIVLLQHLVSSLSVSSHTVSRLSADCSRLSTGTLHGCLRRVTIPDDWRYSSLHS